MGRFRNYVFAVAGLLILAGAFTVIGPYVGPGHSKPPPSVSDVNVVNTPLQTTVQSGNINATVTGNVTVANTPLPVTGVLVGDVLVTNTTAEPVPVVVQNGDADETMVITLAENLTTSDPLDFDAVDMSGFRFVMFHANVSNISGQGSSLQFRFSTQAGTFGDDIPKTGIGGCSLSNGANCSDPTGGAHFRIGGPFLLVRLLSGNVTSLQVFLSR